MSMRFSSSSLSLARSTTHTMARTKLSGFIGSPSRCGPRTTSSFFAVTQACVPSGEIVKAET
jgi:hypothetical protein